jgi:DNA-binding transcriptional ArsR family regulator
MSEDRPEKADPPSRRLRDPMQLRAITHPMRIRLLEELAFAGPATATELAERVGESPANVSWHLRQLARYGFVEEAGGGKGRQRPWRVVAQSNRWQESESDAELALAGNAASEFLLEHEVAELRNWRAASHRETDSWRDASFLSQSFGWLTVEELAAVSEEIHAIAVRTLDRMGDPSLRPPGARPVRLVAWGFPARHTQSPVPADPAHEGEH